MRGAELLVTYGIRAVLRLLCRVEDEELARVPRRGPLIIVTNHVNFLEVPMLYTHLAPRRTIGLVKRETWDNPLLGRLADLWGAIPLDRGGADLEALRRAFAVLEGGGFLGVAPEGTRNRDGKLRRGHPGVALIAARSGAPILPIAHYGGEGFWPRFKSGRRTPFRFRVGEPYRLDLPPGGPRREERQAVADEIMDSLALLLPPARRGLYPDPESRRPRFRSPL